VRDACSCHAPPLKLARKRPCAHHREEIGVLSPSPPRPRPIRGVNWLGFWTLYVREVRRFFKVFTQTVAAPIATTLLFMAIFLLALGRGGRSIEGIPYEAFLAPGLIMMAITQNAFANTSSSLMLSKVQGNIIDILMPPLGSGEVTLAFALGGLTRGLVVGLAVTAAISLLAPLHVYNPAFIAFHAVAASLLLSLLGFIGGIWAEKFDHLAAMTNFIVMPLTFLSGTFYSVAILPEPWRAVADANPFFYMIDGFRYGFVGHADGSLATGIAVLVAANAILLALCFWLVATGYKLKT
jgi:ABC-2 type transport system permease protein